MTWLTLKLLTWQWNKWGVVANVFPMKWGDTSQTYEQKYAGVCDQIKSVYLRTNQPVVTVGLSAGGTVALRLAIENPQVVSNGASLCGMLRATTPKAKQTLAHSIRKHPSFIDSVRYFSRLETGLQPAQLSRHLAMYPRYDELVPPESARLPGAQETVIPAYEHIWGIAVACLSPTMKRFLLPENGILRS